MDNKSSHPTKEVVNLKQLPPIDPFRVMNFSSKGKWNNYRKRAAAKFLKPSPNQGMKVVDSDEGIVKNPTSGSFVVEDESSTSSNKTNEICGNKTSPTHTDSAHEGMKKGSARSNLYETCAANHWKPPIFECYKEEGPSHQRMFTFKVIIELEEASRNIIECYGAPQRKKKTAADHAAEGALWYLKYLGEGECLGESL
ncbi:ribonuclease 3-like protein 1 isoform X2 [Gastrolobium bilobum]|uniref:ribonuclease 3-like protein 1 isoform X2 n=1 Tax=Gastrolobium bilobum TaxID=150636 RepID=UPI002AAF268F|nr:ribonuclease 3-like protein 1 isoform X2 [Gastrolobium bilobum]